MSIAVHPRPRIESVATAVPPHPVPQEAARDFFDRVFDLPEGRRNRLGGIFSNAQVDSRYSCAPVEWFEQPRSFEVKNKLYIDHAMRLLKRVALESIEGAGLECKDIDMIVVVSTSGIAVPSLDARLLEALPFRREVQRLPVFGLGCAGGAMGLGRAATCAAGQPGSKVLYLVVELCTLTFCLGDNSVANAVSTAIFGDGAAGMVVTTDGTGPSIAAWGEHTWQGSIDLMGFNVGPQGLEVRLSKGIPELAAEQMRDLTGDFLDSAGLQLADMDHYACHPGGAKVLDGMEKAFNMEPGGLADSRDVMRRFGNMSAVTVLFVLKQVLDRAQSSPLPGPGPERVLVTGFGPGFSVGFAILEAN